MIYQLSLQALISGKHLRDITIYQQKLEGLISGTNMRLFKTAIICNLQVISYGLLGRLQCNYFLLPWSIQECIGRCYILFVYVYNSYLV